MTTKFTLSTFFILLSSLSGFSQKYELVENIESFETYEIIKIVGQRYEHEIYNDQLCYSYWTKFYGQWKLQKETVYLLKPDSIVYSNNTKIFRNDIRIEILNPDSDWDLISRTNIDKKYNFLKKCTESQIGLPELKEIRCSYSMFMPDSSIKTELGYPQGYFLDKVRSDFSVLTLTKKNKKLIPNYVRGKPTGGLSSEIFRLK
jgi:hypothetical protein